MASVSEVDLSKRGSEDALHGQVRRDGRRRGGEGGGCFAVWATTRWDGKATVVLASGSGSPLDISKTRYRQGPAGTRGETHRLYMMRWEEVIGTSPKTQRRHDWADQFDSALVWKARQPTRHLHSLVSTIYVGSPHAVDSVRPTVTEYKMKGAEPPNLVDHGAIRKGCPPRKIRSCNGVVAKSWHMQSIMWPCMQYHAVVIGCLRCEYESTYF